MDWLISADCRLSVGEQYEHFGGRVNICLLTKEEKEVTNLGA